MRRIAPASASRGLTLIELMITVAIGIILALMALPMYSSWIASQQVRAAAESVYEGIRVAQSEAVRRNQPVSFVLDATTGWEVQLFSDSSVIRKMQLAEGSKQVEMTITPVGTTTVVFDGLGRVLKSDGATALDSRVTVDLGTTTGFDGVRAQRVVIDTAAATGVGIRSCDPKIATGDPRACPS